MEVRQIDADAARALLERDRCWTAYALGDLEPPNYQQTRLLGAITYGEVTATVLLFTLPSAIALLPFGDAEGIGAILTSDLALPDQPFIIVDAANEAPLVRHYDISNLWDMWRMTVTASNLRPVESTPCPITPLQLDALASLQALYRADEGSVFDAIMLEHGTYFGAWDEDRLVAAAGTHVISERASVAAIGGVFTDSAYRGRGLATAVTSRVAQALQQRGIELLVLNVRQKNAPAIAAYQRLGFTGYMPFREGPAFKGQGW